MSTIYIDGSYGEGGGQVLRTSLTLATIAGQPIRIEGIRAGRKKPGMAAQHLTCVKAAAAICEAEVKGDALGSMTLEFTPTTSPKPGFYCFDVSEASQGGSAGAVSLILQTILLPLAFAADDSEVTLRGGTHVAFSPTLSYIQEIYLPMLSKMGLSARVKLAKWGWYPQGGGEAKLLVTGNHWRLKEAERPLQAIHLMERGKLRQLRGVAVVTELPSHIPQRMASRAENILCCRDAKFRVSTSPFHARVEAKRERGVAPGAGIFLTAEYESNAKNCDLRAGFSALGRRGLPAEKVAEMACEDFLKFHEHDAPVDGYLADQLLLPLAFAAGKSQFRTTEITLHLSTNAWAIAQFGLAEIKIDRTTGVVAIVPKQGEGGEGERGRGGEGETRRHGDTERR